MVFFVKKQSSLGKGILVYINIIYWKAKPLEFQGVFYIYDLHISLELCLDLFYNILETKIGGSAWHSFITDIQQ